MVAVKAHIEGQCQIYDGAVMSSRAHASELRYLHILDVYYDRNKINCSTTMHTRKNQTLYTFQDNTPLRPSQRR